MKHNSKWKLKNWSIVQNVHTEKKEKFSKKQNENILACKNTYNSILTSSLDRCQNQRSYGWRGDLIFHHFAFNQRDRNNCFFINVMRLRVDSALNKERKFSWKISIYRKFAIGKQKALKLNIQKSIKDSLRNVWNSNTIPSSTQQHKIRKARERKSRVLVFIEQGNLPHSDFHPSSTKL